MERHENDVAQRQLSGLGAFLGVVSEESEQHEKASSSSTPETTKSQSQSRPEDTKSQSLQDNSKSQSHPEDTKGQPRHENDLAQRQMSGLGAFLGVVSKDCDQPEQPSSSSLPIENSKSKPQQPEEPGQASKYAWSSSMLASSTYAFSSSFVNWKNPKPPEIISKERDKNNSSRHANDKARRKMSGLGAFLDAIPQENPSSSVHENDKLQKQYSGVGSLIFKSLLDQIPDDPKSSASQPSGYENATSVKDYDYPFYCKVCQKECNSEDMLENHLKGKVHKKKLRLLGLEDSNEMPVNTKNSKEAPKFVTLGLYLN